MSAPVRHVVTGVAVGIGLLAGWWWIYAPIAVWYSVRTNGLWLVLLAVLVDGYYGAFYIVPYQSLIMLTIVLAAELLRPHLFTAT